MPLHLTIENETSLPDGGPLSYTVTGKRGIDIGRDQYLDWALPDPTRTVSGKHCEIRYRDGGYWLHDVSRNGTFLNRGAARMQEPHRLRDGDRVEIGRYIIAVRLDGEDSANGQSTFRRRAAGSATRTVGRPRTASRPARRRPRTWDGRGGRPSRRPRRPSPRHRCRPRAGPRPPRPLGTLPWPRDRPMRTAGARRLLPRRRMPGAPRLSRPRRRQSRCLPCRPRRPRYRRRRPPPMPPRAAGGSRRCRPRRRRRRLGPRRRRSRQLLRPDGPRRRPRRSRRRDRPRARPRCG